MVPPHISHGVLRRPFPFLAWLAELRRPDVLRADLLAGITVAMVIIPQSMAYAQLAGLPPVYGLYASLLPPALAALFGSSRQLATGPVAMTSLITAAAIQRLAPQSVDAYVSYAIQLALLAGLMRIGLGLLRLGVLVSLLSAPVVAGFINAGSLIIATSQVHHLVGVASGRGDTHFGSMWQVAQSALTEPHWPTIAMAAGAAAVLFGVRRLFPRAPNVLLAAALTTLAAWATGYEGRIVGALPEGLPSLAVPEIDMGALPNLMMGAATLTFIGLMEAISVSRAIATRTKQRLDIDQEMIGQGLANAIGSFTQSYAVSGSFSRSAVNLANGAVTGLSSVVVSLVVLLVLLWMTPLLHYLPQATLAVIIIAAVLQLFRVQPVVAAWRASRGDGLVGVVTFFSTLLLAPDLHLGIIAGVGLSVGLYLRRTMRPRVAYLSRHADGTLRDADVHGLPLDPQIAVLRFDGRLYFGDCAYFEDKVLEAMARLPELRFLIIDAGGINQIDASGEQVLRATVDRLRSAGIEVYITRVKDQVRQVLQRTGALDYVGRDHVAGWNQHALEHIWARLGEGARERSPLWSGTGRDVRA